MVSDPNHLKGIILVTGCSGRIGMKVCTRLASHYHIVGFDSTPPSYPIANMEFIPMDLGSDESVKNGFKILHERYGDKIVSVIHLAAYYSFTIEHSDLYDSVSVQGTERMLNGLQNFHVEQLIFSSTMLVYAPSKVGHPINEDSPIDPRWDYPVSKVKAEQQIKLHRRNPTVIMRIAGCYDDQCHSISISHQIQRIFEHQISAHLYPSSTANGLSYLHLDDLSDLVNQFVQEEAATAYRIGCSRRRGQNHQLPGSPT